MSTKEEKFESKPLAGDSLPPEFRRFDNPFYLPQHVFNILYLGIITHAFGLYWLLYLFPLGHVPRLSLVWWVVYAYFGAIGISVGAHRYWTHRSFKANLPLQALMMFMNTAAMQYPIFKWSRDHRLHHKYMDGMEDPHSAGRGFWFSHILWLFQKKHPACEKALENIEVSDMARDPVVRFQSKYYWELAAIWSFAVPIAIASWIWPEMTWTGLITGNFARYVLMSHFTFTVNSVVHAFDMDGPRPYDKGISPIQSKFIALIGVGEGWHNYHHTFPWDYSISEFGIYYNLGTMFIHLFASIGWAWDLKVVSKKMLKDRINRTGDGSHPLHDHNVKLDEGDTTSRMVWGWGDENLKQEDVEITKSRFAKSRS